MDLDYLAARIKELEEFELLATTEIKAWLCRIISSRECNDTVKQAMDDAVVTLADLNSKMPAYWKDSAESKMFAKLFTIYKALENISLDTFFRLG